MKEQKEDSYKRNKDTGYEALANAIIVQAADDYRKALVGSCNDHTRSIRSLERFFRSDWFKTLTTVDGEYIMQKIRDEVKRKNM